ncbi:MAG: hypothetical protein FWF34_02155, partial [Alphaproteobacteria bacterium]|nr:hypothetical protein [Alphaproteobacteria bacterium]
VANRQNYLLMMHGYAPFARGYLGQSTLRLNNATRTPQNLANFTFEFRGYTGSEPLTSVTVGGGRPIPVALITAHGINPTGSAADGFIGFTNLNNCLQMAGGVCIRYEANVTRKYANIDVNILNEFPWFDYSGHGSVFNPYASDYESSLAKIVAGWEGDITPDVGDFYGFLPNGQLLLYRTGGGKLWTADTSGTVEGDNVVGGTTFATVTSIDIGGVTYTASFDATTGLLTLTAPGESNIVWFIGRNGLAYDNVGGASQNVFEINGTDIILAGTLADQDYQNFGAILDAISGYGRGSGTSIIANAAVVPEMRNTNTLTVSSMQNLGLTSSNLGAYFQLIHQYYDRSAWADATDTEKQGLIANQAFSTLSNQMLIFGTGEYKFGIGPDSTISILDATLENYAPALYANLRHLFMSVVAVQFGGGTGTANVGTVAGYDGTGGRGTIGLSAWSDGTNTYAARACGMAGRGTSTVDPWCFAAAGATTEQAVAAMAGAVGSVQGAFSYMTNQQIFTLLAVTSDGRALTAAQLQNLYTLPGQYQSQVLADGSNYADIFAEVFGYGLVNLERATRPGTRVFFFTGDRINSSAGNAVWRTASVSGASAAATGFASSGVFGLDLGTVSAPVFDYVESADGTMSMARIFENSFDLSAGRRAVSMGDVLGDFKTTLDEHESSAGGLDFKMSFRESLNSGRDEYGNLDKLSLRQSFGDWSFGAKYERHAGDAKILRGDGENPILGLASHAVSSDAQYKFGRWSFGARGFAGSVTDEGLLENDPSISGRIQHARLGGVHGIESGAMYDMGVFAFGANIGFVNESDTVLGAYSDGLLNLGGGGTIYIDNVAVVRAGERLRFNMRATHAQTRGNPNGEFILGLSDLRSDAYSVGMEYGGWSFNIARPLGVTRGMMQYVTGDYELVETDAGYDVVGESYIANLNMAARNRETRFSMAYRTPLGPATNGAFGFIYRDNPNHTDRFGNESIFMLKLNHKIGI